MPEPTVDKGKNQVEPALQPDSRTIPDDQFLSSLGIPPSPSQNIVTPVATPQEAPPSSQPEPVKQEQPITEIPQPELPKKWLDKFEKPEDLEKYAQDLDRTKTSLETENKMLRKQWDKILDSLNQPDSSFGQLTGNEQPQKSSLPAQPTTPAQLQDMFQVTDDEVNEIMNVDAKGGLNKVFNRLVKENAPRLIQMANQARYEEIAIQQQAKQLHDSFYSTYGEKIKAVLSPNVNIDNVKPFVKTAWDTVYNNLNVQQQRYVDQHPVALFPRVADETVRVLQLFQNSKTEGNGKDTLPAKPPVLSGGGSRPAPTSTSKSEYEEMVDWYMKNVA